MSDKEIRDYLLQAIECLLAEPQQIEKFEGKLWMAKQCLVENGLYALNSLVYRYFLSILSDREFQSDKSVLLNLKDEIIGSKPNWRTYALKHDFRKVMGREVENSYTQIKDMLAKLRIITGRFDWDLQKNAKDDCKSLHKAIAKSCREGILIQTLPDLLVAHLGNAVLQIPFDGSLYFDIFDGMGSNYSLIYPVSTIVIVYDQLNYCESMINKIDGVELLFIDITITDSGYVLNLR